MFKRAMKYAFDGKGISNPHVKLEKGCPLDCGLCPIHKSHTSLGIIDVTNRCNMRCPVCFDAAFATGYVYEPSLDQIKSLFSLLRNNKPVPCPAVQITGGEPTIRDDLIEIIRLAKSAGFSHVELNTNGLRIAEDEDFTRKIAEAGCTTFYLSFEGFGSKAYVHKGRDLTQIKLQAIENCRKAGVGVVLVPTLMKEINDDQLGKIIEFAVENVDVVRCVNVQPVSFVGRFELEETEKYRITIPDTIKLIEEQTKGKISKDDFYPVPTAARFSRLLSLLEGRPFVEFTTSPFCGMATYIYVTEDGDYIPITRFIDIDRFLAVVDDCIEKLSKGGFLVKQRVILSLLSGLKNSLIKENLPKELDIFSLLKNIIVKRNYSELAKFHFSRMIMIGMMHFQDSMNFDVKRVMRCTIHYPTLDGRIIPFCAMNLTDRHGRSLYRKQIETKFSIPLEEWKKLRQKARSS